MKLFPNVVDAKREIIELQHFIDLAEMYEASDDIKRQIIQAYAFTFSIKKVTENLNIERKREKLPFIDSHFVSETINAKPVDDALHTFVRRAYLAKTRHTRKKRSHRA